MVKIIPGSFGANGQMPKDTEYQELKRRQWEKMSQDRGKLIYHISSPSFSSCHLSHLVTALGWECVWA